MACGLKRGFSFFHQSGEELLVAASPRDEIADTHWYRAEVDHFLVMEAQRLGVDYRDRARIETLDFAEDGATIVGRAGEEPFHIHARLMIDATGPRGLLYRALRLAESPLPGMPATESLYSHFTGVGRIELVDGPYPVEDAAVHHVFEGGWVWVLRFNNGITSAGVAATQAVAKELALSDGEPAWARVLEKVPILKPQFERAVACQPFRHMPVISFRSGAIAGSDGPCYPQRPVLLIRCCQPDLLYAAWDRPFGADIRSGDLGQRLQAYAEETECELLTASRLIGALYATMDKFPAFTAVSLLYFAAVSFSETAIRLDKPELATGFLLGRHLEFGPATRLLLERAYKLRGG